VKWLKKKSRRKKEKARKKPAKSLIEEGEALKDKLAKLFF
jgi:hypothetical protein